MRCMQCGIDDDSVRSMGAIMKMKQGNFIFLIAGAMFQAIQTNDVGIFLIRQYFLQASGKNRQWKIQGTTA